MAVDYTGDNIIDDVATFIEGLDLGQCYQTQVNRVTMPEGKFCMLTLKSLKRLSTTTKKNGDTGDNTTANMSYTEVRQVDVQVDIYGDNSNDRSAELETVFASSYGYDTINSINEKLAPLYSSTPINMPMINAEDQYQDRYMLTLTLQAHITVILSQDYFDKVDLSIKQVS